MLSLSYDLHIHSCLSPCGDNDMTPANIVGMAALKELDVIAVTDHNTCKNCSPAMKFGEAYGVHVIAGMELTTLEEVHVVCLFNDLLGALEFDKYVYNHLPDIKNDPKIFGDQYIMDENEQIIGSIDKLLINATDISYEDVYELVHDYNGIMIPAHIEKGSNSLLANLGFVSDDSKFTCFELKDMSKLHELRRTNPYLNNCNVITDSDAHYLQDINEAVNSIHVKSKDSKSILASLTTQTFKSN